ncbi:hypothetical protein ABW20_dc0110541 [Dactylellina cionopaga]|nr:hypothetical protein ABW20_dc0110541 [Dactylellina cionopaga]
MASVQNILLPIGISAAVSSIFHPAISGTVAAFLKYAPAEIKKPVLDLLETYISSTASGTILTSFTIGFWVGLAMKANSYLSWAAENNWIADKYNWEKEIVLITGASSGYGERMTELLAQRGIKVITLSRSKMKPEIAAYANVHWYQCDVSDYSRLSTVAAQIRLEHGDPTVIVNNAALASKGLLLDYDIEDIRKLVDINLVSQFKMIQEFVPAMLPYMKRYAKN